MPESDQTAEDLPQGTSRATSEQEHAISVSLTEEQIQAAHIQAVVPLAGPIQIVAYDPMWPHLFEREAERIGTALGDKARLDPGSFSLAEEDAAQRRSRIRR